MFETFDDFLSENRRPSMGSVIYPKFGQVVIELGAATTEFSNGIGIATQLKMVEKANELKSIMSKKINEDTKVEAGKFDVTLSENISTINLLMENEFASLPLHELSAMKNLILCAESHKPSLVIQEAGDFGDIVSEVIKLGYNKTDIHTVFNIKEMHINLADSDKMIVESLSFDDSNASDILGLAENIELGDVTVAFGSVITEANVSPLNHLRIKTRKKAIKLNELNRKIMDQFIVKEAKATSYVKPAEDTGLPMLEGFKAYDFKQNMSMIESSLNIFNNDMSRAPFSANMWKHLVDVKEAYFANGWKLKHDNANIVLTNATNSLRAGNVCEEYRVELSESGYPLLDVIQMLEAKGIRQWNCETFAEAIVSLNGSVTPERQTVRAFVTESTSSRVFHPNAVIKLRPVTEMVDSVGDLIKALANNQFSKFTVVESNTDAKLDNDTLYSMLEEFVSGGVGCIVEGDNLTFTAHGTKYSIDIDVKRGL